MPGAWHYRIRAVRCALGITARMDMHIGDDAVPPLAAMFPKDWEPVAGEFHNARVKRVRIDVVIEDEFRNPLLAAGITTKQERAAFPRAGARAAFELADAGAPQ